MLDYTTSWGDPTSPVVILLPGAGGTQWLWTPHAELLEDEYRVVAVDLPAHGVHPDSTFSFDRAIADIGEVLDEEGSAVLVGHSLGGHVAMEAASAHEGRVDGLLVAGAKPVTGRIDRYRQLAFSFAIDLAARSTRIRAWLEDEHGLDDERQLPPDDVEERDAAVGMARGIRSALSRDAFCELQQYEGPTLLTYGEDEGNSKAGKELADRVNADIQWYDGGHNVPSRNHSVFTEIVREFLVSVYEGSERNQTPIGAASQH